MWSCSPHQSGQLIHRVCTKDVIRLAVRKTFRWNRPLERSKRHVSLKRIFGNWFSTKLSEKNQTKRTKIQTITRLSQLRKNSEKIWRPVFLFPRISINFSRWRIPSPLEWKIRWGKENLKGFSLKTREFNFIKKKYVIDRRHNYGVNFIKCQV